MSIEAMNWAANLPLERLGDAGARHVLLILANHASNDGRAAFPSVATLMRVTGMARRTVQGKLRVLREVEVIKYGNQGIAQALGLPADRTPTVYDMCMFDERKPQHVEERGADSAPRADDDTTGRKSCTPGAQITTQRGADSAPKPSRTITPSLSEGAGEQSDSGSDDHQIFKTARAADDDADLTPRRNTPDGPDQRFSMHRDWVPNAQRLDAELHRRGLPLGTAYDPGWLADFTAHYGDRPGMQQSDATWLTRFAKWIQQNIRAEKRQQSQQNTAGGQPNGNRQPARKRYRTAAEARAAAEAERQQQSGQRNVYDSTAYLRE